MDNLETINKQIDTLIYSSKLTKEQAMYHFISGYGNANHGVHTDHYLF